MFKGLIGKILILLTLSMSGAVQAASFNDVQKNGGDSWVPWPWGLEAPFPWKDIQGTWRVEDDNFVTYFSLKVVREKTSKGRQLVVRQMDADGNCKIIATGVGYEAENIIRAQMTGKSGPFRVSLRAFDTEDSPIPPKKSKFVMDQVMVLSVTNLEWQGESIHMQLTKVSDSVVQKACVDAEKDKK